MILRRDGMSAISLANGDINVAMHPSTGVYHLDSRYCSLLRFTIAGVPAVMLDQAEAGSVHSVVFTNPPLHSEAGVAPPRSIVVWRRRTMHEGLHETLTISNYSGAAQRLDLDVRFDADFADIFEVRGFDCPGGRSAVEAEVESAAVHLTSRGRDGRDRTACFSFSPQPDRLDASSASFSLSLAEGDSATIEIAVEAEVHTYAGSFATVVTDMRTRERRWLESLTSIETDNEVLNTALRRSLLDIDALRMSVDGETFIAAGVPWFDTLFGRDSLITGMMLAPYSTATLGAALTVLANHQSETDDPTSDARPGKIPHELRWGELSRAGFVPFAQYYGSVDSTPLFLMAAAAYYCWTGNESRIRALGPAIDRALAWCEAEIDGRGLLSYSRTSEAGLENQGWKDSGDAITWPDGRAVAQPIALVEVQGYLVAAGRACASFGHLLGEGLGQRGAALAARAAEALATSFESPDTGYLFCIDGNGAGVPTPASNPGHVLWSGAASTVAADGVRRRLMRGDMFSGWGVRTLGTSARAFNPLGYHTGSVWPHDNALFALGLRRYGFDGEALALTTALVEAALAFPSYRLPELFCGDARELRQVPTPYPVASRPQAWSSAVLPCLLAGMMGIQPTGPGNLAIVRPLLPLGLQQVRMRNLRFGSSSVDLTFERHGAGASVEVEEIRGDGHIVLTNTWPAV